MARPRPDGWSPASPTQEQQWFLDRLGTDVAAYLVPFALRLRGPLDVGALRAALEGVHEAHEVLRSRFELVDGELRQVLVPHRPLVLPVENVNGEREIWLRAAALAAEPFDLTRAPLVRATLLRAGPDHHVLVWIAHHAVADGWSVRVLLDELAARYRGDRPRLEIQYADVAQWQRERLTADRLERLTTFWREHIASAPPSVLPPDRPRPPAPSFRGDNLPFFFTTEVANLVDDVASAHGTTVFAVLLAALQAVLSRYSGEPDAVLGAAMSGRWRAETDRLIGPFATTVPLRVDAGGDPAFGELVDRVAEVVLDGLTHQEMPFGHLVHQLGRARDAGRNPLYQVLFSMDPLGADQCTEVAPGLTVTQQGVPNRTARLDLQLTVESGRGVLRGRIDYNTDLYERATIESFARAFTTAVGELVRHPERPLSAATLLDPGEQERVLAAWEHPRSSWEPTTGFLDQFAAQVAATPDRAAWTCGDRSWTYGELDALSTSYAHAITARGGGRGAVVAVALDRSPELLPVVLGVLRSGSVYLPLDPSFPPERQDFVLTDSHARLVIRDPAELVAADVPLTQPTLADVAYVMYTSGSTGRPKGVVIRHRSLGNFLAAMRGLVESGDRVIALTNTTFDISLDELLLPLTVGAEIVLADRATARNGTALRALVESGITVLHGTPATCRMLVEAGWNGRVRRVLCGGEAMSARLAADLTARADEVWNLFGPTEATVWSLVHKVSGDGTPPIGTPLANTIAMVLDDARRPVPPGVLGELYLGGAGVADGYLNRPDLTAERFVIGHDGTRLYRTGDVCAYDTDGVFHFHGRTDHQVKLRGFRIELGEVEEALTALPGVTEAIALVHKASDEDQRLVAFLRSEVPDDEIRAFLARVLPEHMVPSRFVRLDAFPTTPAGKVDRGALAALPLTAETSGRTRVEPVTATERVLASTVAELVGAVGATDNFFSVGGHSLLVVKLLATVQDVYGVDVPIERFFADPTVRGLATAVDSAVDSAVDTALGEADDLLARVELMSEDEVARLLEEAG